MCEAATIAYATLAIAAASAGVSYKQAKNQEEAQDYIYEQNKENAVTSLQNTYKQNALSQMQQSEAAADQVAKTKREGLRNTSTAYVAAGESGVSGISVDGVLRDIGSSASREVATIENNRDWTLSQINQSNLAAKATAEGRSNSITSGGSVDMSPFLLQAAQGGVSAYNNYQMTT